MDPSLQDIFRKEVQTHLEVFRDYLRKSWVTLGPHYVTDDLYRACHTLRGASRTAESEECIRLSDPLHRWLAGIDRHSVEHRSIRQGGIDRL
jgi:chemosensory pili system protein ChpA (sensor histidine kinase/response regulator)